MKNKWLLYSLSILLIIVAPMVKPTSSIMSEILLGIGFLILISLLNQAFQNRKKPKKKKGIF
ncbi:hypothetical protein [Heyndrickxia acidicola]|uniref:Uncharacterized protein n=1 Tax=Heyndrickxia acidicola TaxID=209389 RepID=A0ABU6MH89_9BACI|nr:hypothetical protein [Heyndrickxia acidicola]MED1204042.1 hypothetical protein [Heyndrickxia acidicola]